MKKVLVLVMALALVVGTICTAYAGMDDEAKALAMKGASFIKENGKDKGIAEIMNPNGRFSARLKGDKFQLTANDFNGVNLANPRFPALVGQNHYTLKDANGKPFIKDAIEIAKNKGGDWIEFAWTDPDTKKIGRWRGWVQRVEGMDILVLGLSWKPKQ